MGNTTTSENFKETFIPSSYDTDKGPLRQTHSQNLRKQLEIERRDCMTEAHSICPEIKIPATFRPGIKELKIFISQTANVSSNFIGMVLGPRGLTHKKLES